MAKSAVLGGVDVVQLREKNRSTEEFLQKAKALKEVLDSHQVPLIINDNMEVAKQVGAYGIHVGNSDLPPSEIRKKWITPHCLGYSIEYLEQLNSQEAEVSDYFGVSPVFGTPPTKTDTVTEWGGLEGIAKIRSLTSKPLVAIGSMKKENTFEVIKAGADCIAVVSAICQAQDPQRAAAELRNEIERAI